MPGSGLLNQFPLVRYRFHSTVERRIDLPEYAGSTLRGAFGHALKRTVCVTRLADCKPCPLYRRCAYPSIFETPPPAKARRIYSQIPPPFVVEPPAWGARTLESADELAFDLVLIGPALRELPLIAVAWRDALSRDIGKAHGAARLTRLTTGDQTILELPRGNLHDHPQQQAVPSVPKSLRHINITFTTPLRLQREKLLLRADTMTPRDLLMALVRRTASLVELHMQAELPLDYTALNHAAGAITGACGLQWQELSRYSNRQQHAVPLGGLMGRWELQGDLAPFWPFLYLGQWLHVGKNCSFGLGRYQLGDGTPTDTAMHR